MCLTELHSVEMLREAILVVYFDLLVVEVYVVVVNNG